MEINGLPLHPLVVHAAVVFGPLSALAALAYVVVPRWRARLRWPMVALAAVALVAIWAAVLTGESFRDDDRFVGATGVFLERLEHHEDVAETLRLVMSGFAVVTFVAAWLHTRKPGARVASLVVTVLVAAGAAATLVYVVLTGDAGSQAVYGQ